MSQFPSPYAQGRNRPLDYSSGGVTIASFMNAVYAWMCVGLATTALVAWGVAHNHQLMRSVFSGGTFLVLILAEFGLVIAISSAINRISAGVATVLFVLYAALNGATLSAIFLVYSMPSIAAAFVTAAGMFGTMSLVGYFTRKDLSGMGGLLFMGLIGLIIASVVNIFLHSSALVWIINYAGVAIFLGLTAYDTQKLKEMARATEGNTALAARVAIVGSLTLYLDFINLFLFLLRLFGSRRE